MSQILIEFYFHMPVFTTITAGQLMETFVTAIYVQKTCRLSK